MASLHSRRIALIALVLLTLVWSYNWVVMKQVLAYSGPLHFVAWRAALATLVLFAILLLRRESLRPPPLLPTIAIGVLQIGLFAVLIQWALVEGGAGRTALLTYTMPFWLVLLARFALGERMGRLQWACIALAAVGLVLVISPWQKLGSLSSTLMAGGAGLGGTRRVASKLFGARPCAAVPDRWQAVGAIMLRHGRYVPERAIDWSLPFVARWPTRRLASASVVLWPHRPTPRRSRA